MTDIVEVIRDFDRAYPEDVFPFPDEKTRLEVRDLYPWFIDGISAGMGRHIATKIQPAADELEALRNKVFEVEDKLTWAEKENETLHQQVETLTHRLAEMACVNGALRADSDELAELRKIIYNFVGRDFAHLEPREALEAHQAEIFKGQGDPICYLYVDPETSCYIVDHCDHDPALLIPAYTSAPKP